MERHGFLPIGNGQHDVCLRRGLEPNCVLDEVIDNLLFDRSAWLTKSHGLVLKLRCLFSSKPQFIKVFLRDTFVTFSVLILFVVPLLKKFCIVKKYM